MRQTVVVVTIGAGIGVACAGRGAVDRSMLFGIGPGDPLAIGAALAVLFSVALAARIARAGRRGSIRRRRSDISNGLRAKTRQRT